MLSSYLFKVLLDNFKVSLQAHSLPSSTLGLYLWVPSHSRDLESKGGNLGSEELHSVPGTS